MHLGYEYFYSPDLSWLERAYCRIFGVPIHGMRVRLRRILPHLQGDFSKILDAGCGKGIFSFEISRRFPHAQVWGVDLDSTLIEKNQHIASRVRRKNLSFLVADICHLPWKDFFSLIVCVDNLEHIENDEKAL